MAIFNENDELEVPELINKRWSYCKTEIYNLSHGYPKFELIKALIEIREKYTVSPNLSEIISFTGFDNAILSIQRWDWDEVKDISTLDIDAPEIGKLGAELMILHTIRESIRNHLLKIDDEGNLHETEYGAIHFNNLNSFNVEITGSKIDIARKRYLQGRLTKNQRRMDPSFEIPSVKRLYWENSIIMLLRAPIPFYTTMSMLTPKQQELFIKFHSKLIHKIDKRSEGIIKVRLKPDSEISKMLDNLTPPTNKNDYRPKFTGCIKSETVNEDGKIDYYIGIGALSMFGMFLLGFTRSHLDDKSFRAERAVRDIIEANNYWKVIESNKEVIFENHEVITEIDIIAQSTSNPDEIITFEVKDFSFWKGWIWNQNADTRRAYYENAVEKLPVKEEYIKSKYNCKTIRSYIVTSIPESYNKIKDTELIYLNDLTEFLYKLSNHPYIPRKRHRSTNFLIRYYENLKKDMEHSKKIEVKINENKEILAEIKKQLDEIKKEYENARDQYKIVKSEYDTAKISHDLISKRLLKDDGEKHYQIEAELKKIKFELVNLRKELARKAENIHTIRNKHEFILKKYKSKENELKSLQEARQRNLSGRIF